MIGFRSPDALSTAHPFGLVVLFGTGWRRLSVLPPVALVGGSPAEVTYIGAQGEYSGLDQINLRIPRDLAGRGEVDLVMQHGGFTANTLRLRFAGGMGSELPST